jgi:hypothetical protein
MARHMKMRRRESLAVGLNEKKIEHGLAGPHRAAAFEVHGLLRNPHA